MKNQDWKLKYSDLKLKFHDSIDVAFRLGFEQGAANAQVQQAQQAQAAQQMQMGQQDQNGMSDESNQEQSDGSELDQHINQLESMLQNTDPNSQEAESFKKSLEGIKEFQANLKKAFELKKSERAIAEISKNIKAPFTLSKTATKNLSEHGKKALSSQEKIVDELMKSFAEEEAKAAETITKTLNFEQLLKG
jgi:hypothetical protein